MILWLLLFKMKTIVVFILAVLVIQVFGGMTKERAIPKVTVRLVRKDWRPKGFNPGTDEPLRGFPGNNTELGKIYRLYQNDGYKFGMVAEPLVNATKLFNDPNYNASLPSVILTHPMTIGDSQFIAHVVGVMALRNLQKHYNVFAMHAPWLSLQFQTSCARVALGLDPMFKPVAEAFATFLLDGISLGKIKPHQINFIGFSYSATLNAYIAREIRDNTGQLTHTLLCLDAFQYNHHNPFFKQVSREDAMFVHMIHSSSKFLGTPERIGTVDITLNNGYFQPGCPKTFRRATGCSHRRSVGVFLLGLLRPHAVLARQCDSWEEFSECRCNDPSHPILMVSFPVNERARGKFYLRTGEWFPFSLGKKGVYCKVRVNSPSKLISTDINLQKTQNKS